MYYFNQQYPSLALSGNPLIMKPNRGMVILPPTDVGTSNIVAVNLLRLILPELYLFLPELDGI